jgi:diadenosine tetraphosphate (Ap4A) HIT family hydrolase
MSSESCLFCQIINGEKPASIVYEDERVMSFLDIYPVKRGHILIVPKIHAVLLIDLTMDMAAHLMAVGQKMDAGLRASGLDCEAVSLVLSDGKAAGQEVAHVHLHVIPRFYGDGVTSCLDPNTRTNPGREGLDRDAQKIRDGLSKYFN